MIASRLWSRVVPIDELRNMPIGMPIRILVLTTILGAAICGCGGHKGDSPNADNRGGSAYYRMDFFAPATGWSPTVHPYANLRDKTSVVPAGGESAFAQAWTNCAQSTENISITGLATCQNRVITDVSGSHFGIVIPAGTLLSLRLLWPDRATSVCDAFIAELPRDIPVGGAVLKAGTQVKGVFTGPVSSAGGSSEIRLTSIILDWGEIPVVTSPVTFQLWSGTPPTENRESPDLSARSFAPGEQKSSSATGRDVMNRSISHAHDNWLIFPVCTEPILFDSNPGLVLRLEDHIEVNLPQ